MGPLGDGIGIGEIVESVGDRGDPESGAGVGAAAGELPVVTLTRGGWSKDGRKVKGTMHWVSARHGLRAEVRNYSNLFTTDNPDSVEEGKSFVDYVDPNSLETLTDCWVEPALLDMKPGTNFQFERTGYFCTDARDHKPGKKPVFNRTATLRDSWAKIQKQMGK